MPAQQLPTNPSLENLRKQAKSLQKAVLANDVAALARVREFHPKPDEAGKDFRRSDAQLVIARSYGFSSWPGLKRHLDVLAQHSFMPPDPKSVNESESTSDRFIRLACLDYLADRVERREKARELLDPSFVSENFFASITVGDVATVKERLLANPRLATTRGGPYNWEPLLYAAYSRLNSEDPKHSTLEVVRLLIQHGADPNAGFLWDGHYLFTALTGAFGEGEAGPVHQPEHQYCYQLARLLLEAGADPNDSQTLYNRMFTGGTRHLELLFEFGLGKGGDGVWFKRLGDRLGSPGEMLQQQMGWAAKYNQLERIKLLVDHGVDVNAADKRLQRTPYELARLHGHSEVARYLLEHDATETRLSEVDTFAAACLTADAQGARDLLSSNPELVSQIGERRVELLQLAAEGGKYDAVKLMVELGFDVNEISRTTPLHHAAMSGDLEMAKLLIELGANPCSMIPSSMRHRAGGLNTTASRKLPQYLENLEES